MQIVISFNDLRVHAKHGLRVYSMEGASAAKRRTVSTVVVENKTGCS
jgi:hypothetical protein